jgi:hypothetical protein
MRVAVRHPQRPDARRRRAAAERAKLKFDFVRFGLRIMVLGGYYFFARLFLFLHRASVHGCSLILCTARASFRVRPMDGAWFALSSRARSPRSREPRVDGMWRRFLSTGHTTIYLPASQLTYTYTYIPQYIYKSYIPVAYCRYSRATSVGP